MKLVGVLKLLSTWWFEYESNESGSAIIAQVDSFNRLLVLGAYQVDITDSRNVSVDVYTHIGGQKKYNRTIKFTASKEWVDQWIEMIQHDLQSK